MSGDGGLTYTIPATALSGNVGPGVSPGLNRRIVWNAGADWNNQFVPNARARVTAFDGTTPVPPAGMVFIPAGSFQMGDNLDNDANSLPVHFVTTNAYFMDRTEVPRELWQNVRTWGAANGYSINPGSFKAPSHPVCSITWHDAMKWCNARSQRDGLTPCYYTDAAQTTASIYKTGNVDVLNTWVKWDANGYRLPTEAEWEKAARGGSLGQRFRWGNTISHTQANYYGTVGTFSYDLSTGNNHHPTYGTGSQPLTNPVGVFAANAYGLHDMAGNLWEWCWDRSSTTYYGDPTAGNNPRGPTSGTTRVFRGGSWGNLANDARCAARSNGGPADSNSVFGFRCVRGL